MPDNFTVEKLIGHFEGRLQQADRYNSGDGDRKVPYYPMLVICLGQDAMEGCGDIASHLFQFWPMYRTQLQFLGVEQTEGKTAYYHIQQGAGRGYTRTGISLKDARGIREGLVSMSARFRDKNRLCLYFVLNTTGFETHEDLGAWTDMIQVIKDELRAEGQDTLDMLTVLLNEGYNAQDIASQIRNDVSALYREGSLCKSVFLLSSWLESGTVLAKKEWELLYRIAAAIIALSNNEDEVILSRLFGQGGIFTVSYAHMEKPCHDIGQVILENLLDKLKSMIKKLRNGSRMEAELAREKMSALLGLSPDGTMTILDQYVAENVRLPTPSQLEHFPRRDDLDYGPMEELSERDFNDLTMDAWDAYLKQAVQAAQGKNLSGAYAQVLYENFFADEMIWLGEHLDAVESKMKSAKEPPRGQSVLENASARLKYMFSSNEDIIKSFLAVIKEQGERSRTFVEERDRFLVSQTELFYVEDETVKTFYAGRMRDYFDHHEKKIRDELRKVRDVPGLDAFLRATIEKIIKDDPVLTKPFDEELEIRLKACNLPANAKEYIQQALTVDRVQTYLRISFNKGEPILSTILLEAGMDLHKRLRHNLDSNTYYYNTGYNNMAEAINIYYIEPENLISNGDE